MKKKLCKKCNQYKEATLDNFYAKKDSSDKLTTYCKNCRISYAKEWNNVNKTPRAERTSSLVTCEYCGKEHRKFNYVIKNAKNKSISITCNRTCATALRFTREFGQSYKFRYYIKLIEKRSRKTNKEMNLTANCLKELFDSQGGKCNITGFDMILNNSGRKKDQKSPYYASVDRIDNSKGYIVGNVQFICLMINYMKNTFTEEDLHEFINRLKKD